MATDRAWFVVRTKPRREDEAEANLRAQGFEVLCPRCRRRVRHARREHVRLAPLFPGYLFIGLAARDRRWTTIRSTRGVAHIVHFGGCYPSLPEDFIAGMRARMDARGVIELPPVREERLRPGDLVRIRTGAFSGLWGVVERVRAEERVIVLVELLQRQVRVELDARGVAVEEAAGRKG